MWRKRSTQCRQYPTSLNRSAMRPSMVLLLNETRAQFAHGIVWAIQPPFCRTWPIRVLPPQVDALTYKHPCITLHGESILQLIPCDLEDVIALISWKRSTRKLIDVFESPEVRILTMSSRLSVTAASTPFTHATQIDRQIAIAARSCAQHRTTSLLHHAWDYSFPDSLRNCQC
jgi:hypothetical protein